MFFFSFSIPQDFGKWIRRQRFLIQGILDIDTYSCRHMFMDSDSDMMPSFAEVTEIYEIADRVYNHLGVVKYNKCPTDSEMVMLLIQAKRKFF
jgi:hypothetical protein